MGAPVVDMTPWIGVIGSCIGWLGFIIVLSMLKNYICTGISIAVSEVLLKTMNKEAQEKWSVGLPMAESFLMS